MTDDVLVRLHDLLLSPDPPELIGRGHRWTQPGRTDRRLTVLPKILVAWVQWRHAGIDAEPEFSKARRYPAERTVGRVVNMKGRR